MKLLGGAGLVFLYAVLFVAGLPALMVDFLFYRSDPFSLSVAILAAALLIFPLFVAVGLAASRLPEQLNARLNRWAGLLAAVAIVDIFLALGLLYLVTALNQEWLHYYIRHPVVAIVLCIIPAAILIGVHRDKDTLVSRVKHLGVLALALTPLIIGYSLVTSRLETPDESPRHIALIVLDGWPTQYLHVYNPQAPRSPLDEVLDEARIYVGAYTSAGWTNGYFGVLFNGDPFVVNGPGSVNRSGEGLAAALQDQGVGVRLINFHRNGTPDASAARRSDHAGFRSYFLTERYAWIPQALGLDYHLVLSGEAIAQNFFWFLPRRLFDWLNPPRERSGESNNLTDILLPELRQLRATTNRSFTLFHDAWNDIGSGAIADISEVPKAQKPKGEANLAEVRANDYRYAPDNEVMAEHTRRRIAGAALEQGAYLRDFIRALRADPELSNTVVVLTADHGSIYAKGRYWYGYHPNREVIRVPFFVFDSADSGNIQGRFTTPELTAAILDYFSADGNTGFHPATERKAPVFSMTLKADVQKEWFLVATYAERSWWLNLHPEGPGMSREMQTRGYDQTERTRLYGPPLELAADLPALIRSFGVDIGDIHPAFREEKTRRQLQTGLPSPSSPTPD